MRDEEKNRYDVAWAMAETHGQELQKIIEAKKHLGRYFVLVVAFWDQFRPGVIRNRFIIVNRVDVVKEWLQGRDPRMLGTVCYRIDNHREDIERLWCLPKDIPIPEEFLRDDVWDAGILRDAEGLPLAQ